MSNEPSHQDIIRNVMTRRYTWWWRMLAMTGIWYSFIPWPGAYLLKPLFKKHFAENRRWTRESSGWLSFALGLWILYVTLAPDNAARDFEIAKDASKVLFSAVFLLGTILSLSVALPGQAVIKTVVTGRPKSAVDFMAPFLWAFMWGILGAVTLMFLPNICHIAPWLRKPAVFIGLYGAFMELHALGHTIRMYTIGLLLWGAEEAKKKAEEAKKAEKAMADAASEETSAEEPEADESATRITEDRVKVHLAAPPSDVEADAEADAEAEAEGKSDGARRPIT